MEKLFWYKQTHFQPYLSIQRGFGSQKMKKNDSSTGQILKRAPEHLLCANFAEFSGNCRPVHLRCCRQRFGSPLPVKYFFQQFKKRFSISFLFISGGAEQQLSLTDIIFYLTGEIGLFFDFLSEARSQELNGWAESQNDIWCTQLRALALLIFPRFRHVSRIAGGRKKRNSLFPLSSCFQTAGRQSVPFFRKNYPRKWSRLHCLFYFT